MPNELSPQDVNQILGEWQDESNLEQLDEREAAYDRDQKTQELLDSTDRMFEIADANQARKIAADASKPLPTFEPPADVKAALERREESIIDGFDRLDDQAQMTGGQIAKELGRSVKGTTAVSAHSSTVHHPKTTRTKTLWRPKGSRQRDIADNDQKVKTERQLRGEI